ncbi:glycosyltransferase family 2 protein [Butyrivibrio sp. DSM 10294]|uniref:glycosyltransferase family 2 protein n=1 Tax=Butyrivibrio sp. DSM 10294 TaxID=2972457 RepID=UPI00234E7EF4|nr:glycosyltransferase family A protein [Butyrivibrio sp. DSM 10294]MDC7292985.1 glycosyltransferase family 2 protein [Butyrivibrio sp. DSM 10294]
MSVKFTVIVPVHNGEKYIDDLMGSVLCQVDEEEDNFEVILVENGSEDVTPAICDRYAEEYECVRALHFGPIGAYRARREGMRAASGDYLVFADVDDMVSDKLIDELTRYILFFNERGKRPDVILYNAATDDNRDKRMFGFEFEENKLYSDKTAFYKLMQLNDSLNALWNKAISSGLAARILEEESSSHEEKSFNHGEDLLQTAEILDKAGSIAYLDSILYYYRENNSGLTGGYHRDALENQVKAWSAFDEYAAKWSGDTYLGLIDERKTLTCCISVAKLIYSGIPGGDKKRDLAAILEDPFYRTYAAGKLPDWAPEESVFVHKLMMADKPMKELLASGRSFRFRQTIKGLIRRKK